MRPVVLCLVLAGCLSAASATRVEAASITFSSGVFDLISIGNNFLGDDPTPDGMHVAAFSDAFVLTEADGVVHRTVNPFAYVVGNTGPESDAGPLVNFAVPRSFTVNGLTGPSPSI